METNLCFEDVLLNGLAKDGGLYMPDKWPEFSYKELQEMQDLDYISLAEKIMLPFVESHLKQKTIIFFSSCKQVRFAFEDQSGRPS